MITQTRRIIANTMKRLIEIYLSRRRIYKSPRLFQNRAFVSVSDRPVSLLLTRLHAHVCTSAYPFSPFHPSRLCIIRELPTLRRPIADPKIRAEWRTIGRTRGRRLASTHNGRHYRCNDLSSPSWFYDIPLEDRCLKMPALLLPVFISMVEKLILKRFNGSWRKRS